MNNDSRFIIKNMSKSFKQKDILSIKKVLKNINLEISGSEITVIVGKSGCGKTTFLRILAGLENISEGSIKFLDKNDTEKTAKIGMVFQEPRLMPWLTVEKNIRIHEKEKKLDIDKILSLVSLKNIKNLHPNELSGGMASRVAIARAIGCEPDILLMDEPFAALDYFTRTQLQNEIIKIHQETRMGIIFVTHNIDEALLIGEKIIVFNDGNCEEFKVEKNYPRDMGDSELLNMKKIILNRLL